MSADTELGRGFAMRNGRAGASADILLSPANLQDDTTPPHEEQHSRVEVTISGLNAQGQTNSLMLLPDVYHALSESEKATLPRLFEK
jgi:AMMECR1 domain-containing protein